MVINNNTSCSSVLDFQKRLTSNGVKVAIVHDFLTKIGGAERVTQALCEIFPDAPIYTLIYDHKIDNWFPRRKIIVSFLQRWYQNWKIPAKFLLPWMAQAVESFDFTSYDLVVSSNNSFAGGIITPADTVHISYCHSPTRYLWDAFHTYVAEQKIGRLGKWWLNGLLHNLRIWDKISSGRVTKYVANSQYVRQRIRKYYRQDATVIYPPVDVDKIQPKAGHADYFLVLSRLTNYKRIDLAIHACNSLHLPLVIIGEGEDLPRLKKLAGFNIDFLGWQPEHTKIEYLKNCRALIFPGEEDFGIVPVEAMAAGKPVIAYRKGGALETVTDGKTGIFFDQPTIESLTTAIRRFISMEDQFKPEFIHQQAQKFNKQRFQREMVELIYQELKLCGKL